MRQHERISARLAWHADRMKELMGLGVSMVAASAKAFEEVTKMKPAELEAWWAKKGRR